MTGQDGIHMRFVLLEASNHKLWRDKVRRGNGQSAIESSGLQEHIVVGPPSCSGNERQK